MSRMQLLPLLLLLGCHRPGVEITLHLHGDALGQAAGLHTLRLLVEGDSRPCCADQSVGGKLSSGQASLRYLPAAKSKVHLKLTLALVGATTFASAGELDWAPGQTRSLRVDFGAGGDPADAGADMGDGAAVDLACTPHSASCVDASTLRRCNADGTAYTTESCAAGACNGCVGQCGLRYCINDQLTDCVDGAPTPVSSCAYGCDPARAMCRQPAASNFDLSTYLGQQPGGVGCIFTDPNQNAAIDSSGAAGNFTNFEHASSAVVSLPGGSPSEALLIRCQNLTIPAGRALRITGPRAVIFAVFNGANISGLLDAAGHRLPVSFGGGTLTAGAGPGGGSTAAFGPGKGGDGHPLSGSGGGGYGTNGGNGGAGTDLFAPLGGMTYGVGDAQLIPPFGGSAAGPVENNSDQGGYGGGAVQITSLSSIVVEAGGVIDVGGAGGGRAQQSAGAWGGGGGGSAGSLLLEAPTVTIKGTLVANGGAGGGSAPASGTNLCGKGDCGGEDGHRDALPALGGNGACTGGNGGNGAVLPTNGGSKLLHDDGTMADYTLGCGGGGAAGRIRINAHTPSVANGAVLSPAPPSALYSVGPLPGR